MHSTGGQDRDGVEILPCEEIIDMVGCGNAELRCDGVGAGADGIAYRDETRPIDMVAAQQLGVTACNAPTSE
jgi:hypothetical protein